MYQSNDGNKDVEDSFSGILSEIELLKQFYKCTAVTSQGELEQSETVLLKIGELKNKMINTEDSEIRKLIYEDLVKTIENSNIPAKETILKNAEVDFNTPFVKNENPNPSGTNVHPLKEILEAMKLIKDNDEGMESFYDQAIEELEKTPDDEKAIALFEEIKTIHSKYFVPDEEEEEEEEEEPKRKPAKKAAPKKVAPVKKAAAKKAPAKRK